MSPANAKFRFGGLGDAFADRNFRIYSIGSIASWISFLIQVVAVTWLTWELTGSTIWLATMALLEFAPKVLLLPFASALADRYDRFKIWQTTNVLLLFQATALALTAWFGLLTIWPLAVLVSLHGILLSFNVPAMYGALPRFVERSRLSSAIAVNSSYTQFSLFAGPALAGWIIAGHGYSMAFAANAFGYVVLLSSTQFLRTPEDYKQPPKSSRSIVGDIVDGILYIRGHSGILALLILILAGDALEAGFYYMLPAYSEQILGMGVDGVSTIMASGGVGATIAALWLAHGGAKAVRLERVLWAFLLFFLAVAVLLVTQELYLAIAVAVVLGLGNETRRTGTRSLIQLSVTDERRGRVMGAVYLFSQLAAGVGTYVIGVFADTEGLVGPMLFAVVLCAIVWLVLFARRQHLIFSFRGIAGH